MTPSYILSLAAVYSLLSFGSTLSMPAFSSDSSLTLSAPNPQGNFSSSNGWTSFWISGDGSQIVPINGPQDAPSNLTAANEDSYTVSFGNHHGPGIPRPGLANFLFECEFGIIDQMPSSSGQGKWTPYPGGKYTCMTQNPGSLGMKVVKNDFGWSMAYRDIAFLIKVVYYNRALQYSAQSFDFVVNFTNDRDRHRYRTVAYGEWRTTNENTAATSSG